MPYRYKFGTEDFMSNKTSVNAIQGEKLRPFLDLCFENAAYFSLQYARWANCRNHRLERRLEPFRICTIEMEKWFGYDYSSAPPGDEYSMRINLYRFDESVKEHLVRWMDDIFMNVLRDGQLRPSTQSIEDLCIFSENGIIMGTVSHEKILVMEPQSEVVLQAMSHYGSWVETQWDAYNWVPMDMSFLTQK